MNASWLWRPTATQSAHAPIYSMTKPCLRKASTNPALSNFCDTPQSNFCKIRLIRNSSSLPTPRLRAPPELLSPGVLVEHSASNHEISMPMHVTVCSFLYFTNAFARSCRVTVPLLPVSIASNHRSSFDAKKRRSVPRAPRFSERVQSGDHKENSDCGVTEPGESVGVVVSSPSDARRLSWAAQEGLMDARSAMEPEAASLTTQAKPSSLSTQDCPDACPSGLESATSFRTLPSTDGLGVSLILARNKSASSSRLVRGGVFGCCG
mmetsp:Transcript_87167/g.244573  ORF Transcript_87167/g.244573 Transcript_87167/m.244573 type:complete len:265 (-) Transcript_87167:408-1202(-)